MRLFSTTAFMCVILSLFFLSAFLSTAYAEDSPRQSYFRFDFTSYPAEQPSRATLTVGKISDYSAIPVILTVYPVQQESPYTPTYTFRIEASLDANTCSLSSIHHIEGMALQDLPKICFSEEGDTAIITFPDGTSHTSVASQKIKNIIYIVTDDQRYDEMPLMPYVGGEFRNNSKEFTQAYVTSPLCCPERASFLSGGFQPYNTNVLTNSWPNGSVMRYHDKNTLNLRLYGAGYTTALVGKYLNRYQSLLPYAPPGWTFFRADLSGKTYPITTWSDFHVAYADRTGQTGATVNTRNIKKYTTDFMESEVLPFLRRTNAPFFLYIATMAPHYPFTSLEQDDHLFKDFKRTSPSYGEDDMSDKPRWVQDQGKSRWKSHDKRLDWPASALRSLMPVDRTVERIVKEIEALGIKDDTVIIFTSDNGALYGEHKLWGKSYLYEEAARVPLLVQGPDIVPGSYNNLIASNLDLPATIYSWAGIAANSDGINYRSVLESNSKSALREHIILEALLRTHQGANNRHAAGIVMRTDTHHLKYIEHYTGDIELYDLKKDPYEMQSQHANPAYHDIMEMAQKKLAPDKMLGLTTQDIPKMSAGKPYKLQLTATGGTPPYTFVANGKASLDHEDTLPAGLTLDRKTGLISGVPKKEKKDKNYMIGVFDSSVSPQNGKPQSYFMIYPFSYDKKDD